jgi:PadR family transcriptional regulator, regulatory protein PadR
MELFPGTLDALILRGLSWGPKHGYAVARWIEESSKGSLTVLDGALYTSLHRMEERGWIAAEWGTSHTGRRARFYRMTAVGKKYLASEADDWNQYVAAVGRVMRTTVEPA